MSEPQMNPFNKKQKVIFVVGPDRCGKTEIVQELSRRSGIPSFKASDEHFSLLKYPDNFLKTLQFADPRVLDLLRQTGYSVIFDRGYPCEKVYSTLFGRTTDYDALRFVDTHYAAIGAYIIVCFRSSYAGIKDDLDPRIDEYRLADLSALYVKFAHETQCKVHLLNVDDENLDREVNEVMQFCEIKEMKP